MNLKNVSWILPLFLAVSCSQTPSVQNTPTASKVLGTVSLGIGADAGGSSVHISPRAAVADNAVTFGLPTFVDFVDAGSGDRYLSATFPVTANIPFSNLTLHAYNKNGSGIGGTAIESMLNFNGGATTSNAQSLLPIHKTDPGILNPIIDTANADFQGFTLDEVDQVTTEANALIPPTIAAGDTILQYGFVARNSTGGRVFVASGTGTITIAYKLPNANVNAAYKFKADFVIADDTNTRVTRGLGDTTTDANTRATAITADDVYLAGADADVANVAFATTRAWNLLTSTTPVCLLSISCDISPVVDISANSTTANANVNYPLNVTYRAAAGTSVTDITVDWGVTPPAVDTFTGGTLTATPIAASHTFATVTPVGTPNTISVDLTDSTTTVTSTTLDVDVLP
jgi:hypothetical protein